MDTRSKTRKSNNYYFYPVKWAFFSDSGNPAHGQKLAAYNFFKTGRKSTSLKIAEVVYIVHLVQLWWSYWIQYNSIYSRNTTSHHYNNSLNHSLTEVIRSERQLKPSWVRPSFQVGIVSAWSAASLQSLWSSIKTGLGGSRPSLGHSVLWNSRHADSTLDRGLARQGTSCYGNCIIITAPRSSHHL